MASTVLQKFLSAGLLDIGTDDERFQNLQKAARDLSKKLAKAPRSAISYTLVALDKDIGTNDPVVEEVLAVLVKHWPTLRNKFTDTPRTLIRAVLFEALDRAALNDANIAATVWLTGASYLPHSGLEKERAVVLELLEKFGAAMERSAVEAWSPSSSNLPDEPQLQVTTSEVKVFGVNAQKLELLLAAAVAPNYKGQPTPNSNRFWPNAQQQWTEEFVPRALQAVLAAVEPLVEAISQTAKVSARETRKQLSDYSSNLKTMLEQTIGSFERATDSVGRRTALLWWRQALYSPEMTIGYRQLDAKVAIAAMAHDLHAIAPPPSPRAVEFLLREAVREITGLHLAAETYVTIPDLFERAAKAFSGTGVLRPSGRSAGTSGRVPLLALVREAISNGGTSKTELQHHLGFEPTILLPLDEVAVWLFRDLQAESLAANKAQ